MKKMSIKQIKFLHSRGLINNCIITGWAKAHKEESFNLKMRLRIDNASISGVKITPCLTILVILLSIFFYSSQEQAFFHTILWIMFGAFVTLIFSISFHGEFIRYFRRLDNVFTKHAVYTVGKAEWEGYALHNDEEWLRSNADKILTGVGERLSVAENLHGLYSYDAVEAREVFKEAHDTLIKFSLCDKDQGQWVPRIGAQPVETSPPVAVAVS